MIEITKENINECVVSGEFDIASETEGLKLVFRFILDKTPVTSIIQSSLKDKRINKQIYTRAHPSEFTQGQIVRIPYVGGKVPVDPKVQLRAEIAGMSDEEATAYLLAKVREMK